jgi:hypothetical protein
MIPRTREALSQLLLRTFPGDQDIDAKTVDAFVDALMRVNMESTAHAPSQQETTSGYPLYRLRATHARRTPVTSVFTGVTEAVRVPLPQDEARPFETPIGSVLPEDHLLPTVKSLRARFGDRIGRPFSHVELLAPPRHAGVRFAPMSLYFGYEGESSSTPVFVVFEPGSATGKPMALYLAAPYDTVVEEPAGYAPTPFSAAHYWYTGGVRMAPNGRDPAVLFMRAAQERGGDPYIRLHVEYELLGAAPFQFPAGHLVEAALRMLAVQKSMGLNQGLIERMLANVGLWAIPWVDRPDNGAPGAAPQGEEFAPSTAFDAFLARLAEDERQAFQSSIVMLLGEVVRADGVFDRLERIELDWIMSFEVPATLGNAFRLSPAAQAAHDALFHGSPAPDPRPFADRLAELAGIIARLPDPLLATYREFVARVCRSAAESSGGWLWFGTKVSAEEKAVLDQIAAALGLSEPAQKQLRAG